MGKRIAASGNVRNGNCVSSDSNVLNLRKLLAVSVLAAAFLFSIQSASANTYTTSPLIIEKEAGARAVIKEAITVLNKGASQLRVYPTVNEVTVGPEGEIQSFVSAVNTNRPTAITSWLAVPRGRFVVPPGETGSLPITITIHPDAKPGTYHALISIPSGTNRADAEAKIQQGAVPATLLRIEVPDDRIELLMLKAVTVERFILSNATRQITIELENQGDLPVSPKGDMVFYNQRGQEVAAASLGADNVMIQPAGRQEFTVTVPDSVGWGKHRANLNIEYGANQRAFLQDTVFFNVLPWYMLLVLFLLLLIPGLLLAWHVQRKQGIVEPDGVHNIALFTRSGTASQSVDHDINLKDTK